MQIKSFSRVLKEVDERYERKEYSRILKKTRIDSTGNKNPKQLERHLKGVANHWRIRTLYLLAKQPGLTLDQIAQTLNANGKTISDHTRRLAHAGLIEKKYFGNSVEHSLTTTGKRLYEFLKVF